MLKKILAAVSLCAVFLLLQGQTINEILSEKNFRTGMIRFFNREYEAAVQLFNRSLSHQPLNHRARYYLGAAYLNSGYSRNALDEWENLVRLGGGSYQVRQKLNDLYFRMSIDKSYDYSEPYVFSKLYDGIQDGMHKIIRPSFIIHDERTDSILVSSTATRYVVEVNNNGRVLRQFGRTFGDFSRMKMPTGIVLRGNRLFVSDYSADAVLIYEREGKYLGRFGAKGFGSSNIAGPMGLHISGDDYLFVADNGNDRIQKFDLQGGWIQTIGAGDLSRPTDIAGSGNTIYVSDSLNRRIVSYDTFGNLLETIGEGVLREPRGLELKNGILYISDAQAGLYRYDIAKKSLEKFGLDDGRARYPFDACLDTKNFIYQTDFNTQNIAVFAPLQLKYANLGVQIGQVWLGSYPNNIIHFRVWDKKGKPVHNLREENLVLTEEGTEIPIFRLGGTYEHRGQLAVQFVVEKSLSMRDYDPDLLDAMNAFLRKAGGRDWVEIMTVGERTERSGRKNVTLLSPIDYLKKAAYAEKTPGGLDRAIHDSIKELLNVNRNKAVVLFVSGDTGVENFGTYSPDTLTTYAQQNAIPVYVVNFSGKNAAGYRRLAEDTLGRYYSLGDIKGILNLYGSIRESQPLEYILSYEGLNLKGLRNQWVNLHLRVKYKDLDGVDDTGYFVPEIFTKKTFFGNDESVIKTDQ